jgi:transcription-repair coupling factor (superfamily II helicase)
MNETTRPGEDDRRSPPVRIDDAVRRAAAGPPRRHDAVGLAGGSGALFLSRWQRRMDAPVLVVAVGAGRLRRWVDDLGHFAGADAVAAVFEAGSDPYAEVVPDRTAIQQRLRLLDRLAEAPATGASGGAPGGLRFAVVSAEAFLRRTWAPDALADRSLVLAPGTEIPPDEVVRRLVEGGYHRVRAVDLPGTFAGRGGIIDLFVPGHERPVRAEWLGDVVLATREFDPQTQRTEGAAAALRVYPISEIPRGEADLRRARDAVRALGDDRGWPTRRTREWAEQVEAGAVFPGVEALAPAFHARMEPIVAHLPPDAGLFIDNPAAVADVWRREWEEIERAYARLPPERPGFPPDALVLDPDGARAAAGSRVRVLAFPPGAPAAAAPGDWNAVADSAIDFGAGDHAELEAALKQARRDRRGVAPLSPLARRIRSLADDGVRVTLTARTAGGCERLAALLRGHGLRPAAPDEPPGPGVYRLEEGSLARGFVLPADGIACITEEEIFGARVRPAARRARPAELGDLRALGVGGFVVHHVHGIGRYEGLERRVFDGVEIDLLKIGYRDGDRLHLPVYHANQVSPYVGQAEPRLDKMGGASFARARMRAEQAVQTLADELLRLHAERKAHPGRPVAPADDAYRSFEAGFPYEETPDQARAVAEVIADLEGESAMDRLVCGDVGFGKTEVALRAAFRVVWSGRQVAVLAPTTLLTQQHLATFRKRFERFPVRVEPLYRFQTRAEQTDVVRRLRAGEVDVVIGTHRLLSKDVHFKELGLVVIDEEHRFGVAHKERLKKLRSRVAVLTLTATPIPRTLHLALGGLRDLSLVTTAPEERLAVRTTVAQADDALIARAIRRELSREGQVFFVHNRVETIHAVADRLRALVPEARFAVGHGQMTEDALERVMVDFVAGRSDVLVCTSIIESGLDIPRANTLVVDRADTFGLAQLYQIRGRVGRSRRQAFCLLLVPAFSKMTADARARIETLARFTALGSGFHVASMDLEIRGAGDLLGAEQSGQVSAVGFDLYCHMLEDAVARLRGEPPPDDFEPEIAIDQAALIPETYVEDMGLRLQFYKRLAGASGESEVREAGAELRDRFGEPPAEVVRLVELMSLKVLLRRFRAAGLEVRNGRVAVHLRPDTPLVPARVLERVRRPGSRWRVTPDLRIEVRPEGEPGAVEAAAAVLRELESCLPDG